MIEVAREIVQRHPFATISIAVGVILVLVRRYCNGAVCRSKELLNGKTVIITGANTGLGKETAIHLAKRNAKVIIACRNVERGEEAEKDIRRLSGNENVHFRLLDLLLLLLLLLFNGHERITTIVIEVYRPLASHYVHIQFVST